MKMARIKKIIAIALPSLTSYLYPAVKKNQLSATKNETLAQLWKEFHIPILLSLGYIFSAEYLSGLITNERILSVAESIKTFGVSFFFVGYIYGQVNRVKKQKRTEKGIDQAIEDINAVATNLKEQSEHLTGLLTGNDDYCFLRPEKHLKNDNFEFVGQYVGKYQLTNLSVKFVILKTHHNSNELILSGIGNSTISDLNTFIKAPLKVGEHEVCIVQYRTASNTWLQVFDFNRIEEKQMKIHSRTHVASETIDNEFIIDMNE